MSLASESQGVHVRAPGKINVYLGVGDLNDDGFHPLATVFHAVSLYEDVFADHADDISVTMSGEGADVVPTDDRNLAVRAARLLATETGYPGGVRLEIHKGVPVAGGMGGGSADAAAALVACDALWETGLSRSQLHELAAQLGADVPFPLHGGTAVGTGRGDRLSQALAPGRFEWVLVLSDEGLSTPLMYARLDAQRAQSTGLADDATRSLEVPAAVLHALRAGDAEMLAASMHNDMEEAALQERPELRRTVALGGEAGALRGMISGSGPTIAFLCASAEDAADVQAALAASDVTAVRAYGSTPGALLIR